MNTFDKIQAALKSRQEQDEWIGMQEFDFDPSCGSEGNRRTEAGIRDHCHKFMDSMPLPFLMATFNINVLDPRDPKFFDHMNSSNMFEMQRLNNNRMIQINSRVSLNEKQKWGQLQQQNDFYHKINTEHEKTIEKLESANQALYSDIKFLWIVLAFVSFLALYFYIY